MNLAHGAGGTASLPTWVGGVTGVPDSTAPNEFFALQYYAIAVTSSLVIVHT
jgi:hypothetical protein